MNFKISFPQLDYRLFNISFGFYALFIILFTNTYFLIYPYPDQLLLTAGLPFLLQFFSFFFLGLYLIPEMGKWVVRVLVWFICYPISIFTNFDIFNLLSWENKSEFVLSKNDVLAQAIIEKNSVIKLLYDQIVHREKSWNITQNAFFATAYLIPVNAYFKGPVYSLFDSPIDMWFICVIISLGFLASSIVFRSFYVNAPDELLTAVNKRNNDRYSLKREHQTTQQEFSHN